MAANIPAKLKAADLTKFCVRAAQLETVKPVVAYWCQYWIVNQILSKGLHNGDSETLQYTTDLMDKLEQIKADNATNDAIVDDTAGQAYVEQFALETFNRADRAIQADKVTKQTADTFQAAATFLELVNIWGPPDGETQAKIKYAKWNAIRIVKALKEGKDPNESNPKPQQQEETSPALDPNDIDALQVGESGKYRKPSVQEVPDEPDQVDTKTTRKSSIDQSLNPSTQVSAHGSSSTKYEPYPRDGFPYTAVHDDKVSPLEPSNPNGRDGSIGGGYFPQVPTFTSEVRDSALPTAPPDDAVDLGLPDHPSTSQAFGTGANFESFPPPALDDGLPSAPAPDPQDYYRAPPQVQAPHPSLPHAPNPPSVPQPSRDLQTQIPHPAPAHPPPMHSSVNGKEQLNTDDAAIAKAQKHARWAISALNFEDAETAVRELRNALKTLGAEA